MMHVSWQARAFYNFPRHGHNCRAWVGLQPMGNSVAEQETMGLTRWLVTPLMAPGL